MLRIAAEIRLWEEDAVREVVRTALAIVDEEAVPDDLREAVFVQACGLLAQKNAAIEQIGVGVPTMAIPGGRG